MTYNVYTYRETDFHATGHLNRTNLTREKAIAYQKERTMNPTRICKYVVVANHPDAIAKFEAYVNKRDDEIFQRWKPSLDVLNEKCGQGKRFTGDAIEYVRDKKKRG